MIETLLKIIAPHHCQGCNMSGTLLCSNCKYDIISESYTRCVSCGVVVSGHAVCRKCHLPYSRGWVVGERRDSLQQLINSYKFERIKAAGAVCGELLDAMVPHLPSSTVVVAVPTVSTHIRQRGYDQTLLMVADFAARRKLSVSHCLRRATNTKQRGASRSLRVTQAKRAFKIKGAIVPNVPYLLIDDVITTGATVKYAAKALKDAGVAEVWVAAIARNPLD